VPKNAPVSRPTKKSEYTICFASVSAQRGWRDLAATIRGPLADSWDFLTRTPIERTPTNYPLKGEELGTITRGGKSYVRWQHKPTAQGDARIWFYVDGQEVFLEQVHTKHPNQTK
jgi:hypothetical protein